MDYIDSKYINILSPQLEQFKDKGNGVYNFRCPYCGDSQTNKTKARGYIFQKEGKPIYKCHNCGQGSSLQNLVKHVNPQLYKEYTLERFAGGEKPKENTGSTKTSLRFKKRPQYLKTPLGKLKKVSQLDVAHPVKKYVESRKIPKRFHYKLFYAPKFNAFAHQFAPDKFDVLDKDEPRLILPFLNRNNELMGFQGRAFGKTSLRYITVKIDEDAPKIFGLDAIDRSKTVYIVEGPIDSMFLDNAVAMAGADVSSDSLRLLGANDVVFVFDNEPRSKEIVKRIEKMIDMGYNISLFPDYVEEKDINDMILAGRDVEEIQAIISNNTFAGLSAKAKLSEWKKV
jgi:transcription elongation factor Elf1